MPETRPTSSPADNADTPDHSNHKPAPDFTNPTGTPEEFWESLYTDSDRKWSGLPNHALVREAGGLSPGRALDLGCGEGADAIWLAREGWRVTAVDLSPTALARAAQHAAAEEVAERIVWRRLDLAEEFPTEDFGPFDLVSAHFLHSPFDLPRETILRRAAATVAPGGVLLVVGHAGWPGWVVDPDREYHFPTPDEVLADLELPEDDWDVLVSEEYERPAARPDGTMGTRRDNTLKIRRLPSRTGRT